MFRLYDANNPVDTLATSHVWQVDAQGRDVELSVRFVLSQLRSSDGKASVMGALAQLAHLLNHLQAGFCSLRFFSPLFPHSFLFNFHVSGVFLVLFRLIVLLVSSQPRRRSTRGFCHHR